MPPDLISRACGDPTTLRAAASSAVRAVLSGPAQRGRVTGVVPSAVYVVVERSERVIALETRDGLGLPCAVVVPSRAAEAPFASVRRGDPALVGGDRLRVGALEVAVVRWWAPRRPRAGRLAPSALDGLLPALEPAVDEAAEPLRRWLSAGGGGARAAVRRLVGLGSGLTPAGDDVLVGALAALGAGDRERGDVLASAVRSVPTGRTTALSATLLGHAADGAVLPALVDVVDALGDPPPPDLDRRVGRLLAVGHSSGAALAHGVALAAAHTSEVG